MARGAGANHSRRAGCLCRSPRTVEQHLRSVVNKLGVSTRVTAAAFAYEHRLTGRLTAHGPGKRWRDGRWAMQGLGPTLAPGQVVVMDNLNVHKNARVRAIIEGHGCQLIGRPLGSMPAYSPDLTPIEGMVSKVKAAVRRAGKREQDALVGAIGAALETVTPRDAAGWFGHCAYAIQQDQSL